jgi:rhodanese-related sulfurtransferase
VFGRNPVPQVAAAEVAEDAILIDVREPDEWAAGHVPRSTHLPMMEIPGRTAEIPTEGDVVIVCRSGQRSANVVLYLMKQGWDNLRNLEGGLQEWVAAGRDLVTEEGRGGRVI